MGGFIYLTVTGLVIAIPMPERDELIRDEEEYQGRLRPFPPQAVSGPAFMPG
jgi:hypothetical protein